MKEIGWWEGSVDSLLNCKYLPQFWVKILPPGSWHVLFLADWQALEMFLFLERMHGGGQIQNFFLERIKKEGEHGMLLATRLTLAFDLEMNYLYLWQKFYVSTQKGRLQAQTKSYFCRIWTKVSNKSSTYFVLLFVNLASYAASEVLCLIILLYRIPCTCKVPVDRCQSF